MRIRHCALPIVFCAVAFGACNSPASTDPASKTPIQIPDSLKVEVEVNGKPAAPIDAARLRSTKPDLGEAPWNAWRLSTLLGSAAAQTGSRIEVMGEGGTKWTQPLPAPSGANLGLMVNRKGQAVVVLLPADGKMPSYHGRGGKAGREGHLFQRIQNVRKLRVMPAEAAEAPAQGNGEEGTKAIQLRVVQGENTATWGAAEFDRVRPTQMTDKNEQGSRSAWSLRTLATALLGKDAAITELRAEDRRVIKIDAAAWKDENRIPVLRVNRRGQLKFQWLTKELRAIDGEELRGVTELHATKI